MIFKIPSKPRLYVMIAVYSEGAALGKNALSHPSSSHFHLHLLLQHCGNTLLTAWLVNAFPNHPFSHPCSRNGKLKALGFLYSQHETEQGGDAPGRQQLQVNCQVNREGQELVSVLPVLPG